MSVVDAYLEKEPSKASVEALAGRVLLEFGTPWCSYCQAAAPNIIAALSDDNTIAHLKIYDGKGKRLGRAFSIKLWPSLILLENGIEIGRLVRPESQSQVSRLLQTSLSKPGD